MKRLIFTVITALFAFNTSLGQTLTTKIEYHDSLNTKLKSVYTVLPDGAKHGTEKCYNLKKKLVRTNTYQNGVMTDVKAYLTNGLVRLEAVVASESDSVKTFYTSYTSYAMNNRGRRIAEEEAKLHKAQEFDYLSGAYKVGAMEFSLGDYRLESYKRNYLSGKVRVEFTTSEDKKSERLVTYDEDGTISRDFTYNIADNTLIINKFDGFGWAVADGVFTIQGSSFKHQEVIEENGLLHNKAYDYPIDATVQVKPVPMGRQEFYNMITTCTKDADTDELKVAIKEHGLDNIRYEVIKSSGDTSGVTLTFIGRRFIWEWQANDKLRWAMNTVLLPNEGATVMDGVYHGDEDLEWEVEATYKGGALAYLKVKQHGDIVQGDVVDNKFNGNGSSKIWSDLYVGQFKDNLRHGNGKLDNEQGMYIGEFKDGKKCGKGKLHSEGALPFFIEFVNTMQNAQEFNANSFIFEGEFKDDLPYNGIERTTLISGDKIEFSVVDGSASGRGKYVWKSGGSFEGNDLVMFNGNGKLMLENGDYYSGDFDTSNGGEKFKQPTLAMFVKGVVRLTLPSNMIYEGEYNESLDGSGRLILSNGDEFAGNFWNCQLNILEPMKVKLHLPDGSVYEGAYVDEKFTGPGKLTLSNGEVHEGNFKAGKLESNKKIKVNIKKLEIPIVQMPLR